MPEILSGGNFIKLLAAVSQEFSALPKNALEQNQMMQIDFSLQLLLTAKDAENIIRALPA